MSQPKKKKRDITITVQVDDEDHRLEGIPSDAWESFKEESKRHFPNSGEDSWASYLSEVIVSTISSYSYFMTDVPEENAKAMNDILGQVHWNWEQFHVYLLKSAVLKNNFRIISFHPNEEKKEEQLFGTFIATGIDPKAFSNIEISTKHSFEELMATIITGCTQGTITISPNSNFVEPL